MMIRLGNFLFHYRNGLFPVAYLLLFAKAHLVTPHYRLAALLGFAVAASGQILRAATIGLDYIRRGGKDRRVYADGLVTGGLFAHCRNPLYVGNYLVLVGLAIASCSAAFLVIGLPAFALAYWAIIQAEEDFLRRKFGQAFDDYCARVSRLGFNLKGLGETLRSMEFNWRRLLTAEYGSTAGWMGGMTLVALQNVWIAGDYSHRDPFVVALWILSPIIAFAWCLARYLKKSGIVKG